MENLSPVEISRFAKESWNWYIILITNGSLSIPFSSRTVTAGRGLLIIPAPCGIEGMVTGKGRINGFMLSIAHSEMIRLGFANDMFFYSRIVECPYAKLKIKELGHLKRYMLLIKQALHGEIDSTDELFFLCRALVLFCHNYFKLPNSVIENNRQTEIVNGFIRLVSENCRKQRSMAFYADRLSIAPKYLSSIITSFTGKTASQWIREFTLENAKALLSGTALSVNEISDKMNFITSSDFTKYFKKYTGLTPKEFRKDNIRLVSAFEEEPPVLLGSHPDTASEVF